MDNEMIYFSFDLEDPRHFYDERSRYPAITTKVLDFLDERSAKGTFFVVGETARAHPRLIQDIAARGHEIACHSLRHIPLDRHTPESFCADTIEAKDIIEQAAGKRVEGYRAPTGSLIPKCDWAIEILHDLGFVYSSSIMPVRHPLYGWPGALKIPFRWPCGLVEIPFPVAQFGPILLPYLGGIYFRYCPIGLVSWLVSRASHNQLLWTYCHAHDFDNQEKYAPIAGLGRIMNLLFWLRRKHTFRKYDLLLRLGTKTSLVAWVRSIDSALLPVFQSR